jgi:hypothetical protein
MLRTALVHRRSNQWHCWEPLPFSSGRCATTTIAEAVKEAVSNSPCCLFGLQVRQTAEVNSQDPITFQPFTSRSTRRCSSCDDLPLRLPLPSIRNSLYCAPYSRAGSGVHLCRPVLYSTLQGRCPCRSPSRTAPKLQPVLPWQQGATLTDAEARTAC